MSKSKEQCKTIISKNFSGKEDKEALLNAIELSIKEICSAEFALLWQYNQETNTLKILNKEHLSILKVNDSLMKQVLLKKEGFFDNHVASHRDFNEIFDNPLKIQIKSLLIAPILDKSQKVIGMFTAYNSFSHGEDFQRYDLRCLSLLNVPALKFFNLGNRAKTSKITVEKKVTASKKEQKKPTTKVVKKEERTHLKSTKPKVVKSTGGLSRMKKAELEEALLAERKKVEQLEQQLQGERNQIEMLKRELLEKEETLNALKSDSNVYEVEVVEEASCEESSKKSDTQIIFDFLTKEVTYFANKEHMIYLFLEIIRNSLHHKEQLHLINEKLNQTELINSLVNELSTQEKLVVNREEFNPTHLIAKVAHLYIPILSSRGIRFNLFIDPQLPLLVVTDADKLKSIIIHLMNNVAGLVSQNGVVELFAHFSRATSSLVIDIKGIKEQEKSGFFSTAKFNHSVVTSETGLGLSISSNLANLLGGKLKLATIGLDEHSFMIELPVEISRDNNSVFYPKQPLKIAILAQEENENSLNLLQHYLSSFAIPQTNIMVVKNYKKIKNMRVSHLFCFENMLTPKVDLESFESVTILKYVDEDIAIKYEIKRPINEILLNSYYGLELQKILFPHIEVENIIEGTLVKRDTLFSKLKRLYSHK